MHRCRTEMMRMMNRINGAVPRGTRDYRRKAFCRGNVYAGTRRSSTSSCSRAAGVSAGQGDRHVRPDLVVGSGSYGITHQECGRTPSALTRSTGFSSFKNYGSGKSKLLVAIQMLIAANPPFKVNIFPTRLLPHTIDWL